MKKLMMIVLMGLIVMSCDERRPADAQENSPASETGQATADEDAPGPQDVDGFLQYAAMVDRSQIRIGEMAQEKAADEETKVFGQMLITDHGRSLQALEKLATDMQLRLPDSLDRQHQLLIDSLQIAEGEAFDRQLILMMIEAHQKDIPIYERVQEQIGPEHPAYDWIDEALPSLNRHLQKAQQLQNQQKQGFGTDRS